jgi:protein SCO1/2
MRILIVLLGCGVAFLAYLTFRPAQPALILLKAPPGQGITQTSELPKLWPLPEFTLTERSGKPVTLADLRGKIWIADFIYTTCPGPCPILSGRFSELQKAVAFAPDVRLVSISSDPENDTPEVLRAYADRFHATDRWLFLTGNKTQIHALANQGFKLSVVENRDSAEPIIHSTRFALVDRQGLVRGFYDGVDPKATERLLDDVRKLLGERL